MKPSKVLEFLLEEVSKIPSRADGNINGNDLYIAIEDAYKRARAEEEENGD